MRKKYKITGFARFLIFMVFFAPLEYIGASYYNGEDGIANIKKLIGLDKINSSEKTSSAATDINAQNIINMKDQEILSLNEKIAALEKQLADCQ